MYKITHSGKNLNKSTEADGQNTMKHIKAALTFTSLLGLTYIFGILAVDKLTLACQWLFCIFNSLQGFCIFYLSTLTNKDVKKEWRQKIEERIHLNPVDDKERTERESCHWKMCFGKTGSYDLANSKTESHNTGTSTTDSYNVGNFRTVSIMK